MDRNMSLGGLSARLAWLLLVLSLPVNAEKFCLLLAENYVDHLFSEIESAGEGGRLPSFGDFRQNNEMTQALLLKRPAAKLGVAVTLPRRSVVGKVERSVPLVGYQAHDDEGLRGCQFQSHSIQCGGQHFFLVANQSNSKLVSGALDEASKMKIPVYVGSLGEVQAVGLYLTKAYRQYIRKMLEIGLGGSTFSYAKFVYLFHDVTGKGIDFSQRFETMFHYLKQDKRSLGVSEKLPGAVRLDQNHCDRLNLELIVCDAGARNYLYSRRN
mgnify:CR=1 FL=1